MRHEHGSHPSPCSATRTDGEPCRARARPGRTLCTFHDPELAEARAAARKRGGAKTRERWRARLAEVEKRKGPFAGILTALLDTVAELRDPSLPTDQVPRLRGAVYGLSVALRALEVSELDAVVLELNTRLDGIQGSDGRLLPWPAGGEYGP